MVLKRVARRVRNERPQRFAGSMAGQGAHFRSVGRPAASRAYPWLRAAWAAAAEWGLAVQREAKARFGAMIRGMLGASAIAAQSPAVLPNPSLNTRPPAACRLGREALVVYHAPRGPGVIPPGSR